MTSRPAFAPSWVPVYADCMDYTPIVLKNKGIPTEFAKTQKSESGWGRVVDEDGEPEKEIVFVKFTNNSISDIELHFGGLETWQEQLEKFPITTIRQTLAFVLKRDIHDVGEAMLDGEVVMYSNVIGTAWSIANGVDPTTASRLLKQSVGLANEQKQSLNEQLNKAMQENSSLGTSGSDSGPKRASRSKTSGT